MGDFIPDTTLVFLVLMFAGWVIGFLVVTFFGRCLWEFAFYLYDGVNWITPDK